MDSSKNASKKVLKIFTGETPRSKNSLIRENVENKRTSEKKETIISL